MQISRRVRPIALLLLMLFAALFPSAQSQNPVPAQPPETRASTDKNAPELTSHDAPTTFSTRVSLVMVPVVVRDRAGKAIGTLHEEDFALFDKGKPQLISKFSVEKAGGATIVLQTTVDESTGEKPSGPPAPPPPPMAGHFVAYLFDDVNSSFGDLAQARDAARKQIADTLQPTDRIAIASTSGQTSLDFTDDHAAIENTLLRLRPRPKTVVAMGCPDISYYQASMIDRDPSALEAAIQDTLSCMPNTPRSIAEQIARSTAAQVLSAGDYETRLALNGLKDVIRRISAMPGQRVLVLVSSGFLLLNDHRSEETDIIDRAIRANVTINTLDARGLYAPPELDASKRATSYQAQMLRSRFMRESALAEGDVLGELADATGGTWFHNRNDLDTGFRLIAASPEYTYVLGFSPQNLKYDGAFHTLKVTLKSPSGLALRARRGYYAPKHEVDPKQQSKEEIREALFSREEMKDIPVSLQTQFFKPSDIKATLAVLAHVDLKAIRFRKAEGRNRNSLVVVSGIFDRNGILINAVEKTIDMFLKDETFAARTAAGLTVKTSFDVTPGNYVIRLVVRDSEGQMMTAQNGVVQIP